MPLKFVTANDNVFRLLGDQTSYRGSAPGPRWGLPSPSPLACAVLIFPLKIPWQHPLTIIPAGPPRSDTLFNYVNIMPCKLQNTRCLYRSYNFNFAIKSINCVMKAQSKCARLFENTSVFHSELQCFSARRLWVKQRSSLVYRTIVTKLQRIRVKQNLFTSADDERRTLMKMTHE